MTLGGETSADYAYALTFNVFETNKTPFLCGIKIVTYDVTVSVLIYMKLGNVPRH